MTVKNILIVKTYEEMLILFRFISQENIMHLISCCRLFLTWQRTLLALDRLVLFFRYFTLLYNQFCGLYKAFFINSVVSLSTGKVRGNRRNRCNKESFTG